MAAIVVCKFGERHLRERNDLGGNVPSSRRNEAMADAAMRGAKAEPCIPLGHGLDAVQPGVEIAPMSEHGLRQRESIAFATISRLDDIEANEGKLPVVNRGQTSRDRLPVDHAREESLGIDGMEAGGVVEAGIPSRDAQSMAISTSGSDILSMR